MNKFIIFFWLCCHTAIPSMIQGKVNLPLHEAINDNKDNLAQALESVNQLLAQNNIDLSRQDNEGNTALHVALKNAHELQPYKKYKTLLDLQKAYYYQMAENIIDAIIKKYPQNLPPRKWWHRFLRRKRKTCGEVLSIQNTTKESPLDLAITIEAPYSIIKKILSYTEINIDDVNKKNLLFRAAENGDDETIQELIKSGIDVTTKNETGETALHIAAKKGHLSASAALYKHKLELLNSKDNEGNTPLHLAVNAEKNNSSMCINLLKAGADQNVQNNDEKKPLDLINSDNEKELKSAFRVHDKKSNVININIIEKSINQNS